MNPSSPALLPVNHVQQRYQSDCLATCVDMVLRFFNTAIAYRRLLKVLKTDPTVGTPFSNIVNLRQLRLTVVYQQGDLAQLHTFVDNGWPVIVPVETRELPYWHEQSNHAVVVIGMDAQAIYINDPAFASAPLQVPRGDFDLAWLEHDESYAVLAT